MLIHILFNLGEPHENPRFAFPEIIELLRQSKNRPFILYKVCILIEHQRPEIIPYLLCEEDFAELGMLLMNKIKLSNYSVRYTERAEIGLSINMLKQELTHEAFISLLNYSCIHQNMVTASKIIVRALNDKAKELFYMPFNYNKRDERQKNIYLKAYNDLWDALITYQIDDNTFSEFGRKKPLFILSIYQHLIAAMLEDDNSYGRNELFSPPLWRFEVLIKMLKTLKNPSIFNKAILNESYQIYLDTKGSLINEIQKSYKHLFTVKKVLVRSDSISDIEERDVIYRSNYLGINWVEWHIYVESLSPTQREEFYNASNTSISLSGFDDKWDVKLNGDIEAKIGLIRFHLQVLIACHNTVQDLPSDETVLRQGLEQHITRLFCEHYRLDIPNNKIDIFDKDENDLLEDILGISNEFQPHSRDMIVNTVISYPEFLDRVFIALNILISENDSRALQSAINAEAVDAYLTNAWGQQKAQYLLVSAINNIDLAHIAQQIVNHIEDRSSTSIYYQQSQVQLFLYHIKLVLADRLNDRLMLESLTLPEAQVHFTSEMREAEDDKKRFFIIRADWRSGNLVNALRETEQIALRRKDNADFIFMRFDLQLENAMIEFKNDTTRRLKAIKEAYELLIKDESDTYYYTPIKSIAYKKLKVFHLLQWGEHFDSAYFLIKRADRFFPDIAALKIDNCINRKRWAEATDFLRELENFHKNRYQDIPDFVEILRDKVSSQKEFLPYLKDAYKSILTLTAEERIKALPSVISPFTNEYGKFLLNELFVAALALQEKFFATLKDTDDLKTMKEDNITDFFETILNARLGMIGLHWQCQNRAGRSDKTNALQRSDLSLKSGNALRVLEALRVYSSQTLNAAFPNIEDHILKSFDQTSSRKDFYCVIYYQASSFDKDWPLLLYAVNKIAFPERFKLMEEAKEISESSSSDIKTAYSTHGGGVTHYYMLVNLRYPVNEII